MPPKDRIRLKGLAVPCILGVFDWERKRKQKVVLDLSFPCDNRRAASTDRLKDALDYKRVAKAAIAFAAKSRYHLVETLAEDLASHLLETQHLDELTLRVSKPGAIRHAENVGVEITRRRPCGTVHFSLGSNIDAKKHLSRALDAFARKFASLRTSSLYETSPLGNWRQTPYWNLVVEADTRLRPAPLRVWAHGLELKEGRKRGRDKNGPRTLDVDLVDYHGLSIPDPQHPLPHPDLRNKAFVLFPFLEIAPAWTDPDTGLTLVELAARFKGRNQKIKRLLNHGVHGV